MMKAELSEDDIKQYEKDCKKKKNAKGAECMAYAKRTAKNACKDDDMAEGCSGDDEKKVKEAMKKYCMDNMEDEKCQARGEKVMHCCDKSDMCEMCGDGEKYMWGDCMPISCESPLACADEDINVHCQDLEEEMDGMMFTCSDKAAAFKRFDIFMEFCGAAAISEETCVDTGCGNWKNDKCKLASKANKIKCAKLSGEHCETIPGCAYNTKNDKCKGTPTLE